MRYSWHKWWGREFTISGAQLLRLRRKAARLGITAVCTYIATCLGIAAFQRHLIYFPDRQFVATPRDYGLAYEDVQFMTEDGVRISAWWVPAASPPASSENVGSPLPLGGEGWVRGRTHGFVDDPPSPHPSPFQGEGVIKLDPSGPVDLSGPVFVFFHGNAGNISHRIDKLADLHNRGVSTLIVDYRGYGRSAGSPSEAGLYRDADAAWKYLIQTLRIAPHRIVLFGESLGGAVAIELAGRTHPGALIVECTFSRLVDVGRAHYPLVPVNFLLVDRFDSLAKIRRVTCPKLFLHGTEDQLVPISLARRLFDAALPPKQFVETPGDHNEAGFSYSPKYGDAMMAFLRLDMRE